MIQSPPAVLRLSDLSSRIDIPGFYSRYVTIADKPTNSKEGKEWASDCPECFGTDRFSFWGSGRYHCIRGCGIHGSSPYFFLRDVKGYSHQQALSELGIDQSEIGDSSSQPKIALPLFMLKDEPPCQKWQEQAHLMCHIWEKVLWSKAGQTARDYLYGRGFKDETIRVAHLGLNPSWHIESLETWGLDALQLGKSDDPVMKIPRGIIIPWVVSGSVHKIQIRRPEPGPDGKKYKEVLGSSDALYNIDTFQPGQPVLLVESELDALSVMQEAGDLVACLATGSTVKALTGRWIGTLKQASKVLQAFDNDEAGEQGAAQWLAALPNAYRWAPRAHDVNDMLTSDESIKLWVEVGLDLPVLEPEQGENIAVFDELVQEEVVHILSHVAALDKQGKLIPSDLVERVRAFQERPCAHCGGYEWMLDEDGKLVCPCILPLREQALQPRPALPKKEFHYCPHCQAIGHLSPGGVELAHRGQNVWASTFRKTPGKPYVYVWIESQGYWLCPGCFDERKTFSGNCKEIARGDAFSQEK